MSKAANEPRHGIAKEDWPPVLPPADVSLATMLDWHSQGCEWPVGGDETTIALARGWRRP